MANRRNKVVGTFERRTYLGKADPPRGWLVLHDGKEITCNEEGYWLDPGHKRNGHHLVAMGGELYEMQRVDNPPPTGQAA